ncbi:MAG TPA: hypothetical protein PLN31_09170 [Azoarcus taiwanensis]|nr:hypothetical protein [Azoarcus taiwanensis]
MNMPMNYDPKSDPSSGVVPPRIGRATVIVTVVPTVNANLFVRKAAAVNTCHTASPTYPNRVEADDVRQDRVDSVMRFPASNQASQ